MHLQLPHIYVRGQLMKNFYMNDIIAKTNVIFHHFSPTLFQRPCTVVLQATMLPCNAPPSACVIFNISN